MPLAALAGALVGGVALYALAWRNGVQGQRFVLVGIGTAALAQAGVGYVLTEGRIFEAAQAYVWLVGSVNGRGWEQVWPLAATLALLAPALAALARRADALELGDDLARSLGVAVERSRLGLLAAAVALTGSPSRPPARSASSPSSPRTSPAASAGPPRCRACCRWRRPAAPRSWSPATSPAACCSRRTRSRSG